MLAHVQHISGGFSRAKGDGVRRSLKFMAQPGLRRSLLALGALGALYALGAAAAQAQNLDQGKSAVQLFNDGCAACHSGAPGLARGRSRAALLQFLQEHYTSGSDTAAALASYLASVDRPQGGRSRPAVAVNPSPPAPRTPGPRTIRGRHRHSPGRHSPDRIQTQTPPTGPAAAGRSFP
jgi:mono/diheme cytochrome c family protein